MNECVPTGERWQLKRQDDHGNQYEMGNFGLKEQAEDKMTHYQNKGHKQTYWVEKVRGK